MVLDLNTGKRFILTGPQNAVLHFLATRTPDDTHTSILYKKLTVSGLIQRHGEYNICLASRILSERHLEDITVNPSDFRLLL